MPTYEYACKSCGHDLEVFQRMSDDPLERCPSCNTLSLKRKIGLGAGIIFKGGGFYETDFKDRKGSASSSDSSEPAKKEAKKEAKPAIKDGAGE
jgi:putative FmdB family regulatory protein